MTTQQLTQFLKDNGIEPTTDNLITCLCDRFDKVKVARTKRGWYTEYSNSCATGDTLNEALLELMATLELEGEKATEDYLYNYNLNK